MKVGNIDKTDFLIPPFAFFYFYVLFAAAFDWPSVSTRQFFRSEPVAWAGALFCLAGLSLLPWNDGTHPICGDELRALRRLQREQKSRSPFVFTSERGAPFTTAGFARMIERLGEAAGLGFKPHPHMLRHACGFTLANKGYDTRALQGYLGHRNIQHTVRYTELSPERFKDFWR